MNIQNKTHNLILIALFTALTAICAWIAIPLPFTPVPIVLAPIMPIIASSLLGTKNGAISMVIYVVIGAIGAPVFSNFTGGLGILIGPTGGYLIGYIGSALTCGITLKHLSRQELKTWHIALSAVLGFIACYILGTAYFMFITNTKLLPALMMCIVPFLLGDFIKIVLATVLIKKLKPLIK